MSNILNEKKFHYLQKDINTLYDIDRDIIYLRCSDLPFKRCVKFNITDTEKAAIKYISAELLQKFLMKLIEEENNVNALLFRKFINNTVRQYFNFTMS